MKYLPLLFLANVLLAQDPPKTPSPAAIIGAPLPPETRSVMVIDPKARTNDYVQAFNLLRKDKPSLKMMVRTMTTLYTGVTDLTASSGETLLLIKVLSNQGIQTQIIPVEQIVEINYSP